MGTAFLYNSGKQRERDHSGWARDAVLLTILTSSSSTSRARFVGKLWRFCRHSLRTRPTVPGRALLTTISRRVRRRPFHIFLLRYIDDPSTKNCGMRARFRRAQVANSRRRCSSRSLSFSSSFYGCATLSRNGARPTRRDAQKRFFAKLCAPHGNAF